MVKCCPYRFPMDLVRSFRRLRIGRIIPGILKSKWRRGQTLVIERGSGGNSNRTYVKKERPHWGTKRKNTGHRSPPPAPPTSPASPPAPAPEISSQDDAEMISPRKLLQARRRQRHHSVGEEGLVVRANDFSVIITPRRETLRRRRSTPIQSFTVQEMAVEREEEEGEGENCCPTKADDDSAGNENLRKAFHRRTYVKMIKGRGCFGKTPKVMRSPPLAESN